MNRDSTKSTKRNKGILKNTNNILCDIPKFKLILMDNIIVSDGGIHQKKLIWRLMMNFFSFTDVFNDIN